MTEESPCPASIVAGTLDTLHETLPLAFDSLDAESRVGRVSALLADFRAGRLPLDGIWEARRQGRLVAALFSQVQPGKTAVAWPPGAVEGEPSRTRHALMETLHAWLVQQGVSLSYAMFDTIGETDQEILRRAGYRHLVDLLYLVCQEADLPRTVPSGPLEFDVDHSAGHARLAEVMNATYQDTLDCPQMNGLRRPEDVLQGYRATGVYRPELWLVFRHGGKDVGCLVMADHPEFGNCELVYMGLVPEVRGKRLGRQVTDVARWQTRRLGRERLVLAVDEKNEPARAMYVAAQFTQWDRKTVHMTELGK